MQQLKRKIPEAEIREWLDLPVTRRYFEALAESKEDIEHTPCDAYFVAGNPQITQEELVRRVAYLAVLGRLLDPDSPFAMINYNVEGDEDDE